MSNPSSREKYLCLGGAVNALIWELGGRSRGEQRSRAGAVVHLCPKHTDSEREL